MDDVEAEQGEVETQEAASETDEMVIALGEEFLNVDKKTVDGGITTVRRFVVERPASVDVDLVAKTVVIERREPIDINALGDVLSELVVEMVDISEEPVVSKGVRMVQEVVVRRVESVSVRTVHDTVRYDDVSIEQPHREAGPGQQGEAIAQQG